MRILSSLRRSLAAFAACILLASPVSAAEENVDRIAAAFESQVEAGFTGYAIVVVDGKITFSRGAGIANAITGREMDEDTQFDIASITKTLTGVLVAQQIAGGRLTPDTRLDQVLDVAGSPIAGITIHQLLTHTAGLVDVVGEDAEEVSLEEVVARAATTPLLYEPGSSYRYSNLGYSLLAAVLERQSAASYEDQLEALLAAAGAHASGYDRVLDSERSVTRTEGQSIRDLSWGGHPPGGNLLGNGGVVSTPADMVRWLTAYRQGILVSGAALDLAHTPHVDETGEGSSYAGYGLVVEEDPDLGTIYWHNGGSQHFNSHWREFADHDVLIIALSDQRPAPADRMVLALQRALFDQGEIKNSGPSAAKSHGQIADAYVRVPSGGDWLPLG